MTNEAQLDALVAGWRDMTSLEIIGALLEARRWRPIEMAPKDGTQILVVTIHGEIEISLWINSVAHQYKLLECGLYEKVSQISGGYWNSNTPTHWHPLPLPPEF